MTAALPKTSLVRKFDTHRLISTKHRPNNESVLTRIADDDAHLAEVFDLDHATNERLLAENGRSAGIGPRDLVFDVPGYRVVNAAFAHPHPLGARFNGPDRGAWYSAFELATSQAEIAFHKTAEYAEIGRFDDQVTYDDYLSDVSAELHDLRADARFEDCLSPKSYVPSQKLAARLVEAGSLGVVYPSVRRPKGTCIACFRPSLVTNVRRAGTYTFVWDGAPTPKIRRGAPAMSESLRKRPNVKIS
ncbi:MAG: RES family NAD+ phosphorylase, partial [Acidobacteria bacterium]|nr:RES family NAD+ phosphorylase [Acidobacteriota bacterium]